MCGILLIGRRVDIKRDGEQTECVQEASELFLSLEQFLPALKARGPDAVGHGQVHLSQASVLELASSLLQLRGQHTTCAPHRDDQGNILLFNGEIFGGLHIPEGCNDGQVLMQALGQCSTDVPLFLSELRGPWALMYWQAASGTLWFGRDAIGRRSLLIHFPDDFCQDLCIASVSCPSETLQNTSTSPEACNGRLTAAEDGGGGASSAAVSQFWEEVEPGIYSVCFGDSRLLEGRASGAMQRHAWADPLLDNLAGYQRPSSLIAPQPDVKDEDRALAFECAADKVLEALQNAVALRCKCIDMPNGLHWDSAAQDGLAPAPVLVLFSGGVDSTLLATCAHMALPPDTPIDLASICFDGGNSPDRMSALDAFEELKAFAPVREWRLILVDAGLEDVDRNRLHILDLLRPSESVMDLNIGAALWLAAQAEGPLLLHSPGRPSAASPRTSSAAAPADKEPTCSPPEHSQGSRTGSISDAEAERSEQPSSRGEAASSALQEGDPSQVRSGMKEGRRYRSRARVVLLGHGADELCAGYGRHRTRFRSHGWEGLSAELALDVGRLWRRNLGRDDRIIADVGREARHPFLDEAFVATLLAVPLPLVADLQAPPGAGDKMLLRAALRRLGLKRASVRVKRAIQFGSRLSRQANVRDFGSNRAANMAKAGGLHLSDVPKGNGRA